MSDMEILIIDPDEAVLPPVKEAAGPSVKAVQKKKLATGLKALRGGTQIVLIGNRLPDDNPIEAIALVKTYYPDAFVVFLAPEADPLIPKARTAGACDVIHKPVTADGASAALNAVYSNLKIRAELDSLRFSLLKPPEIIARSKPMRETIRRAEKLSGKDAPLLIIGEDGTGRRLMAKYIHLRSGRKNHPFKALEPPVQAAPVEDIIRSASGGTLFAMGAEALEKAASSELLRLGKGRNPLAQDGRPRADVRLVACLNGPSDYGWPEILIPPLRERPDDILPLAEHFLIHAEKDFLGGPRMFSMDAADFMHSYQWPGNVRELKGMIRKAYVYSEDNVINRADLMSEGRGAIKEFLEAKLKKFLSQSAKRERSGLYGMVVGEVEKALIEIALAETGSQVKAARALGISRNTLRAKMKEYAIE